MTDIEHQYRLNQAAEQLQRILAKQGRASIAPSAPQARERQITGTFDGASISLRLGPNQANQVVLTALRIDAPAFEHTGFSAEFQIWEPSIEAAAFVIRSFLADLSSRSQDLGYTVEALATLSDMIAPHRILLKELPSPSYRESLRSFLGAPTHERYDAARQSTKFTFYLPVADPVAGHFDVFAEALSGDTTLVTCQLISPHSRWHGRYSRVVRSSTELETLGRIILDAASSSSNQEERFLLLAIKMNYREVTACGAALLPRLKFSVSARSMGLEAEAANLRDQLRPRAAYQNDRYLVRRGVPFPATLRRTYRNLPQINGLCRPILYVHTGEELAVQFVRPSTQGFSHVTAWWALPKDTAVYNQIIQQIGKLTVFLASASPNLGEFKSALRVILQTAPSGFTFADAGELHPELKNIAELMSKGDALDAITYRPQSFVEALYHIAAGKQFRSASFLGIPHIICHTPAIVEDGFVVTDGELSVRDERAGRELVVKSPLSHSDKDSVAKFLSGDYSASRSLTLNPRTQAAQELVQRLLSDLALPRSLSNHVETPFNKLQAGRRTLHLESKRVDVRIGAVSDDHVIVRFYEIYESGRRPEGGADYFKWLLKKAALRLLSLGPPTVRLEIRGSGVQWGAVSTLCHQLTTILESEWSGRREAELRFTEIGDRLFSPAASCRVTFSGFGWRCGFDSRDGRTVSFKGNYLLQAAIYKALESPPTAATALKFLVTSMKAKGLF